MSLKDSLEHAKQLRLSWKTRLAIFLVTIIVGLLFVRFGRFELASPTLFSALVIAFAIATKWEMKVRVWFWITMAIIAALHIPLILFVPWGTRWVPAIVIVPVLIADLCAMLAILAVVEKLMETAGGPRSDR